MSGEGVPLSIPCPGCHADLVPDEHGVRECPTCGLCIRPYVPSPEELSENRATIQKCRQLLLLVAELHQLGYERARIVPFIVDTAGGGDWHCIIAPAAMISATCGADIDPHIQWWRGESPPGRDFPYFIGRGWRLFLPGVSSAKNLVRGFPRLAEQCVGCDGEYVEWYLCMLQKTAPEGVVYANAYWDDDKCPAPKWMRAFDADRELELRVPVPPPGRASP